VAAHLADHPDGKVFASFPRSGTINAAQILAEWGDSRDAYDGPDAVAALGGLVPVTRASGKYRGVNFRWACNKRLRVAVTTFADNSRHESLWAADIYRRARDSGKDHQHAVRILARAWVLKSEPAFGRHAGVAPIPVWSGSTAGRVRLTRSGNRQLNAVLHRIAVTQIRLDGLGQAYYRRLLAGGTSKPEALRCLKRRLARVVFHHLHTDRYTRQQPCRKLRLDIGEAPASGAQEVQLRGVFPLNQSSWV
jgi:transposase